MLEIRNRQEQTESIKEKDKFLDYLRKGLIQKVLEIKDTFSEEFLQSAEVIEAAKIGFLERLENGFISLALEIRDKFNIPEEFLQSAEIIEVAKIVFLKI